MSQVCLVPSRAQQQAVIAQGFIADPGRRVIQAPAVFTLSQWVSERSAKIDLLAGRAAARNADPLFLLRLWNAEVTRTRPKLSAAESFALAKQAREADRMIRHWCAVNTDNGFDDVPGEFFTWRNAVHAQMRSGHWFSNEDWIEHLCGQLKQGSIPPGLLPLKIVLSGFVEFTRLETSLLESMKSFGIEASTAEPPLRSAPSCSKVSMESQEQELSAAARWARGEIESGRKRVAVIVHELPSMEPIVQRVFEDEFIAAEMAALVKAQDAPFNINSVNKLAQEPLVRDAFMLLQFSVSGNRRRHDFHRISRLLRSANLAGGQEERFARAQLELQLRKRGIFRISLNAVAEQATRSAYAEELKRLIRCINGLNNETSTEPGAEHLLQHLSGWGWPGDGNQDQRSVAVVSRFLNQLESLSLQDFKTTAECLAWLKHACEADMEDSPGGPLSPIQVMGVEAAVGQEFESARILNLTSINWPGRPYSNPFLPSGIIKEIPRASENGMLNYAQVLTRKLQACAEDLVFSWTNRLDDQQVSCSPLINDISGPDGAALGQETSVPALWRSLAPEARNIDSYLNHPWLREVPHETGTPISGETPVKLNSAVRFLGYQSACPMAAFLSFRLGAQMPDVPQPFEGASYRGELIHAALEQLYRPYRGTGGHPGEAEINAVVDLAMDTCAAELRLLPAELTACRMSLVELLVSWLDFDTPWDGWQLEATEWRGGLELEGFHIDLRIDRINRLDKGGVILLDYKSGAEQSISAWADQRLGQIQLPLYAVMLAESGELRPSGIALAYVKPNGMKWIGLSDTEAALRPGISGFQNRPAITAKALQDWDSALAHWRSQIVSLLSEIRAGVCINRVFDEQALKYADLGILLRREEGIRRMKEGSDLACQ